MAREEGWGGGREGRREGARGPRTRAVVDADGVAEGGG